MPSLIMLPPEGETKRPRREVREGSEEPAPKAKGKPMTDTEKTCDGDCGGDCSKCSKKKGKKTMFAEGFKTDSAQRGHGLKCGKGAISKGEKCHKGPSVAVQAGQTLKAVGRGALETVKWTSGYNLGKTIATGMTGGKNEKATSGKAAAIITSGLLFGPQAALGAARRVGSFGATDLQQHAKNEKKEKQWRHSVGYRDSVYASGFAVDQDQLAI
jgi:hypothetical protein